MNSGSQTTGDQIPRSQLSEKNCRTILVCGLSGVGKTRFINTATGSNLPVGHTTYSETERVMDDVPLIEFGNMRYQLVDSPGFQDNKDDDEVPVFGEISTWLCARYLRKFRIVGIIYLRSIQEARVNRAETALMKMFKKLCGEELIDRITLVTNRWQGKPEPEEEAREQEMVNDPNRLGCSGTKRVRVARLDGKYTKEDALNVVKLFEGLEPVTLRVQQQMIHENKSFAQTDAGQQIISDLNERIKELNEKLKNQDGKNQALEDKLAKQGVIADGMKLTIGDLENRVKEAQSQRRNGGNFADALGRTFAAIMTLGLSEFFRD